MDAVDGNAIAGTLIEVFGEEMTLALSECARCRRICRLAELAVFLGGPGIIARCRECDTVLMAIVYRHGIACVDLMGMSSLEQPLTFS